MKNKSEHLRRFLLITLIHTETEERKHINPKFLVAKFRSLINCQKIIVATEKHKDQGDHFHIGVLNDTASRYTITNVLRKEFSEFEGRAFNVTFHKSFNTIIKYLFKQDPNPYLWGTNKEECLNDIDGKNETPNSLVDQLLTYPTWSDVLKDKDLIQKYSRSFYSLKGLYHELKAEVKKESVINKINSYLQNNKQEHALIYQEEEMGHIYPVMNWLAKNFAFKRQIRDEQLFIYGRPKTGKTSCFNDLAQFLDVYYISERPDDFTDFANHYDLVIDDEFLLLYYRASTRNKFLDGSPVRLDIKSKATFLKLHNLPVIIASNQKPLDIFKDAKPVIRDAFMTRIIQQPIQFTKHTMPKDKLCPFRIAQTLKQLIKHLTIDQIDT